MHRLRSNIVAMILLVYGIIGLMASSYMLLGGQVSDRTGLLLLWMSNPTVYFLFDVRGDIAYPSILTLIYPVLFVALALHRILMHVQKGHR